MTRPGLEPGPFDPESSALTTRPPRLPLGRIGREPLNNSLPGQTNTKEARINHNKDGEAYDGFQMTNSKNLG